MMIAVCLCIGFAVGWMVFTYRASEAESEAIRDRHRAWELDTLRCKLQARCDQLEQELQAAKNDAQRQFERAEWAERYLRN